MWLPMLRNIQYLPNELMLALYNRLISTCSSITVGTRSSKYTLFFLGLRVQRRAKLLSNIISFVNQTVTFNVVKKNKRFIISGDK